MKLPTRINGEWVIPVNSLEHVGPYPSYSKAMIEYRILRDNEDRQAEVNVHQIQGDY